MQDTKQSVLTLEQQQKLSISGVASVDSFTENAILLSVNGKRVQISGSKLKVLAFSEGSGNFVASGEVTSIKFGGDRSGFKKLFR